MRQVRFRLMAALCLAAGLSLSISLPAHAQGPQPEDFVLEFSNVQISPDGQHVATIRPFNGRSALVIYRFDQTPAEGGEEVIAIPSGDDVEISGYMWASNDRLLIQAGFAFEDLQAWHDRFDDFEGVQLISINMDGTDPIVLGSYPLSAIDNSLSADPDHVIIRTRQYRGWEVYRVNIRTGEHREVRPGRNWRLGTMFTDDNQRIRVISNYPREEYALLWRGQRGNWRHLIRQRREDGDQIGVYGIFDDGNEIYMYSNHEGRSGLYRMRPLVSDSLERVFLHDTHDAGYLGWSHSADQPSFISYTDDLPRRHYLDAEVERLDRLASELLPGSYALSSHFSLDQSRGVFVTVGTAHPTQYYLYDEATEQFRIFAPTFPTLRDEQLARVEAISYEARDGLEIHGYLAYPPQSSGGPYPMVVLPHGGPASRDDMSFDLLRQFFATRGYAVFQPNYRGSTGYGNEFFQAGWEEWGRGMQDDVTDGVRFLINQGIADPERICIAGWSYGAYAALLGVATTPDLYQCAIGINGVYDVEQLRDPRNMRYVDAVAIDWELYLGDDIYRLSAQRDVSPRYLADQIEAPVLIIASAQDLQARMAHSVDMIAALEAAGAPHESQLFESGDHSLNFGPAWLETLRRIDAFLDEHL